MNSVNPPTQSRRDRAAATRERVIQAATDVFTEAGYAGTRMVDIATRAGVAVQTLYYMFRTKAELLQACVEHAVLGSEALPPPRQPFWAAMTAARSGRRALGAFVLGNAAIMARAAELDEVQKAATHEPDAAKVAAASQALRRDTQALVVADLADRFGLRQGLDLETATDLFVLLCGTEVYLTLQRSGWSEDKYVAWLTDTLARQLLARPGSG